jgi:hypothetical protein
LFCIKKIQRRRTSITVPTAYASELPGWWLKDNFGSSVCDSDNCKADTDPDLDKLTNAQEFYYHSNPVVKDTNKNGLSDGEDVAQGFDPSKPGKVTFEEASSDDSIVGESLVFDKDIKKMFAEEVSPDKVKIPEPDPSLIKTSSDDSKEAITNYLKLSDAITKKYLPQDYSKYIESAAATQNQNMIVNIQTGSINAIKDLSQLSVPSSTVQIHKYLLTFFQLLPEMVNIPSQAQIESMTDAQANLWYDHAQAFMLLVQKIGLEQNKISKL